MVGEREVVTWRQLCEAVLSEQKWHEPLRAGHVSAIRIAENSDERALLDGHSIAVDEHDRGHQDHDANPVAEGEPDPEKHDHAGRVRRMADVAIGTAVDDGLITSYDHCAG